MGNTFHLVRNSSHYSRSASVREDRPKWETATIRGNVWLSQVSAKKGVGLEEINTTKSLKRVRLARPGRGSANDRRGMPSDVFQKLSRSLMLGLHQSDLGQEKKHGREGILRWLSTEACTERDSHTFDVIGLYHQLKRACENSLTWCFIAVLHKMSLLVSFYNVKHSKWHNVVSRFFLEGVKYADICCTDN